MMNLNRKLKKISLFDILLIVFAILLLLFLAYTFFRKLTYLTVKVKVDEDSLQYHSWMLEYGVVSKGYTDWFSRQFYVGMKEKDGLGRVNAELIDIRSYDMLPPRKALYLTLRLKVVHHRASDHNTYKGKPVLVGSTIKLYLDNLLVDGLITYVEGAKDQREKVKLNLTMRIVEENSTYLESSGTSEHVANAISLGEEVKDDQNNTVIKVLDKRIEDAKKVVSTSGGDIRIVRNPLRKDVYLTLLVNAVKMGNRYYLFDDMPILVGGKLPINTNTVFVLAEVIKIAESGQQ